MMTSCFTPEQINKISNLVKEIEELTDVEKLFLYLQLPCGLAGSGDEIDVARSKLSNLPPRLNGNIFTRKLDQETTQTYTWILSHLEVDQNVSLPKQEVYDEYKSFCQANRFEPLCVADFGKAMKHTFPCIKPRRLGHRGNSRYCYSGLRKKYKILPPSWPEMTEEPMSSNCSALIQSSNLTAQDESSNSTSMTLNSHQDMSSTTEGRKSKDRSPLHNKNGTDLMRNLVNQKQCSEQPNTQVLLNQDMDTIQSRQCLSSEPSSCQVVNNISLVSRGETLFSSNQPYFNYNYPQTIHQPVTPDDDDYQHNYEHKEGHTNRQFVSKPLEQIPASTGVLCNHLCSQQQEHQHLQLNAQHNNLQVHYSRVQPINSATNNIASTSINAHHMVHDPMLPQTNFCIEHPGPSSSSSTSTTTMNSYISLSRLNGASHIDSYASPFQSPASTPYPSISSNYMNHDSQDYFSMHHYASS